MEYDVGQVLYAVSHKEMKVIPLRVTERIVRQTLEGEIVTYVAQLPDGRILEDLSRLRGDVHTSLDEVRSQMIDSITGIVDKIVDSAKETAAASFGRSAMNDPEPREDTKDDDRNGVDDKTKITLPDGTVANIKIPDGM